MATNEELNINQAVTGINSEDQKSLIAILAKAGLAVVINPQGI